MSQDYHQGISNFSNGFDRSHQHVAQQIRRDKLRVQGFDPPPLVGIDEDEESTADMLSEMFNFPPGPTATGLLQSQILQSYRNPRPAPPPAAADWFLNHHQGMAAAAASDLGFSKNHTISSMQLFQMNPQQRSPSPPPSNPSIGGFGQFTWVNNKNPSENIPSVGQGLSLSLTSSPAAAQQQFMNLGGGVGVGYNNSSTSANGGVSMLRSSKYAKAAQELLEEFCSVGRGQSKKSMKFQQQHNDSRNPSSGGGDGNLCSSSKVVINNQRSKVKLLTMLDEVDRRYNHYCEQMQIVVNSFDMVMGFGAAAPYTSLAQKAMSRHFRCLKDTIVAQLGEKDGGVASKGETPRLRMLEQRLRQQRAYNQMEQEAWRPQRGLPEGSVNILRAWLFEHFLNPYPSDADKHLLSRQTGLSKNQISNWFINARVRLWKPMVEEMYQQEAKDDDVAEHDDNDRQRDQTGSSSAQNPTPYDSTPATAITPPPGGTATEPIINAHHHENESLLVAINTHGLVSDSNINANPAGAAAATARHSFPAMHEPANNNNDDIEDTLIRFEMGTAGDVSLTLGLRHAGNLPEKGQFSVRDFGGC